MFSPITVDNMKVFGPLGSITMWWVITCAFLAGLTVKKAWTFTSDLSAGSLPIKSQLVHPVRLDTNRQPLSGHQDFRWRSLEDWEQSVVYEWIAFNRTFVVVLENEDSFIAPQFHLQMVDSFDENATLWIHSTSERRCYYKGRVESDEQSRVSVSLCQGMFGLIHTSHGDYTIESAPSKSETENVLKRVHLMTQLSLSQPGGKKIRGPIETCYLKDSSRLKRRKAKNKTLNVGKSYHNEGMRSKRSVSIERHVEVLVVVDRQMANQYGENLRHYVLTLMSAVAMIYKEPSLGNFINIAVVKLVVLSEEENREVVHSSASKTLRSFCRWQQVNNHDDDSHPHHHDTAVLITREDLCRVAKACDTLGLANPGMVCSRYSSCAIVEDNGLSAAFTIAHELGHVLGIPHDDDFKCRKHREHGKALNVMARMLDEKSHPWDWSPCSKKYLTNFLDTGKGECLNDKPIENLLDNPSINDRYLGELYDMDYQCELVFGGESKICPYMPVCRKLWCTLHGTYTYGCRTQHMPWADGTFCGPDKWCQRGECVKVADKQNQEPIDGQWGEWQEYGPCSRKCGGGVQRSVRHCDSPRPANRGKYCLGRRTRYLSCHMHPCPFGTPDPRAEECSLFNGMTMNFPGLPSNVKWLPYYSEDRTEACKLYCQDHETSAHFLLKDRVTDGIPCWEESFDVCVNGVCENAGCDRVLGSNKTLDRCGICGGDSSTCKTVHGHFNEVKYGYNSVVMIPAGATNIVILQYGYQNSHLDDNYLALLSHNQNYLLNGNFTVTPFKKTMKYFGATLEYSGSIAVVERINSSKPLKKKLYVQVLTVGSLRPPDIRFEYTVSLRDQNKYRWDLEKWSSCSHLCGGETFQRPVCIRVFDNQVVNDNHCDATDKPLELAKTCNDHCILRWNFTVIAECSHQCGPGTRQRDVKCLQEFTNNTVQQVNTQFCVHLVGKPRDTEQCEGSCPKSQWIFGNWSECSKSCGRGEKTRSATCVDQNGLNRSESRCELTEKITRQECNIDSCPQWMTAEWTECSASCGEGMRTRYVTCHDFRNDVEFPEPSCDQKSRPIDLEVCNSKPCGSWRTSEWSQCLATCGRGIMTRHVVCMLLDGTQGYDQNCDSATRPEGEKICNLPECSKIPGVFRGFGDINHNKVEGFFWRTGPWGACSRTCNGGIQRRQVACYDELGKMSDQCESAKKPVEAVQCSMDKCPEWSAGEWQECNKSCGRGFQTRQVACRDERVKVVPDYKCDVYSRPFETKECNTEDCPPSFIGYRWYLGPWSSCSVTCGKGIERRQLRCIDGQERSVSVEKCDGPVPENTKECIQSSCPEWMWSEWTVCSVRCGQGIQSRHPHCKEDSIIVDSSRCEGEMPRTQTQSCSLRPCNYQWSAGEWTQCLVSCGQGTQHREVVCLDESQKVVSEDLCKDRPPVDVRDCRQPDCAYWVWTEWSRCSSVCGQGKQIRHSRCFYGNETISDFHCEEEKPEPETRLCFEKACVFRWKKGIWSKCSVTCGRGRRQRFVSCIDSKGGAVADKLCGPKRKPKTVRRCKRIPACPLSWVPDEWTQCSSSCGPGVQLRRAFCHEVNSYGWVNPEPVPESLNKSKPWCDREKRPKTYRFCNLGYCNSGAVWKPWPWRACPVSCGVGKQRRRVPCYNLEGKRISRKRCNPALRPKKKRKCTMKTCSASAVSCHDIQKKRGLKEDGEQDFYVRGKLVKIYCAKMNTSNPQEYISLPSGESNNYSEIYDKRLLNPDTCPYGGNRQDYCPCVTERRVESGLTMFSKVAVNLTTLQVITDDFTFSKTPHGQRVRYGEAGDCYSLKECPQGHFSINLKGTGFIVSKATQWEKYGTTTTIKLHILKNGETVQGKCGGYCGKCTPDVSGLMLDVAPL